MPKGILHTIISNKTIYWAVIIKKLGRSGQRVNLKLYFQVEDNFFIILLIVNKLFNQ